MSIATILPHLVERDQLQGVLVQVAHFRLPQTLEHHREHVLQPQLDERLLRGNLVSGDVVPLPQLLEDELVKVVVAVVKGFLGSAIFLFRPPILPVGDYVRQMALKLTKSLSMRI